MTDVATIEPQLVAERLLDVEDPFPFSIHEGGWVTMRAGHPNPFCQWHNGLCGYVEDDPERCPWCHSTWATILRTDWHSCERASGWSNTERNWRVHMAGQLRGEAAQDRDRGARAPHVRVDTLRRLNAAQSQVCEAA